MTQPVFYAAFHSIPRLREVLSEQVRAVGFALRGAALAAAALTALATLLVTIEFLSTGGPIDFAPQLSMLSGMVGLLLPLGVWKGEERFGAGFLWTLPVDRRRHALAKVFAGWVLLMGAVLVFVLWQLGLALCTGGNILAEETLRLLPTSSWAAPGLIDPGALQAVRWMPEPLLWLVPFTAATGTYLLASAVVLGVRHPLRWIAGTVLGLLLLNAAGAAANAEWLAYAPGRLLETIHYGPYGLDALLTARTESLKTVATLPSGEVVGVWRGLPDVGQWATATLLWTGAGLAALWAAASRHRERR